MSRPFILALLLLAGAAAPAFAQALPRPGESARAFELRAAGAPEGDDTHILTTKWNGRPYVFVDFPVARNISQSTETEGDRDLIALAQMPDGSLKRVFVTTAEEEGGEGSIAAIGFGHPGQGPDDLIVLISWPVQHADVAGTLYEVRLFGDPGAKLPATLSALEKLGKHFDHDNCDCGRTGEKPEHFPFKTMAAIKAELKKLPQ
jgi:hypothetical protein